MPVLRTRINVLKRPSLLTRIILEYTSCIPLVQSLPPIVLLVYLEVVQYGEYARKEPCSRFVGTSAGGSPVDRCFGILNSHSSLKIRRERRACTRSSIRIQYTAIDLRTLVLNVQLQGWVGHSMGIGVGTAGRVPSSRPRCCIILCDSLAAPHTLQPPCSSAGNVPAYCE